MAYYTYQPKPRQVLIASRASYSIEDFEENKSWYRRLIREGYPGKTLDEAALEAGYLLIINLCCQIPEAERREYLKKGFTSFLKSLLGAEIYESLAKETLEELENLYRISHTIPPADLVNGIRDVASNMVIELGTPVSSGTGINVWREQDD